MNNRFKFRVWDKKLNKFTLGYDDDVGYFEEIYSDPPGIFFAGLRYLNKYSDRYIIQQYTGLTDKNNKPIYEGDFIRGQFDHGSAGLRERILPVRWSNEEGYYWNYWDLSTIEVVGNEFENPELLK